MSWKNDSVSGSAAEEKKTEFQTPHPVCKYMVSLIPAGTKTVLEPTPGIGNLVASISNAGYQVHAPVDFWDLDFTDRYDCVVCNLPFSGKTFWNCPPHLFSEGMEVYYKALGLLFSMTNCMVALVPWFTLIDSDTRLKTLFEFGLMSVTNIPRKAFDYARITTCVIQLQKGYAGPVQFSRFNY